MHSQHTVAAAVARTRNVAFVALIFVALLCGSPSRALAARIFLDPGHGGRYLGAVYGGVKEKYVNLLISLETRSVLQSRGHDVAMSRTGDYTVCSKDIPTWHWDKYAQQYYLYADGLDSTYYDDLQARCDKANTWEADIFISIHNNAGGGTGTETFYNSWNTITETGPSKTLATYLQKEIVASAGTYDRRVDDVGYYVIRWANMPAALVEVAFLDNDAERALLLTPAFRHSVAVGIANAIDRYLAADLIKPIEPRVAGATRYETAVAIAREGWPSGSDTVLIASGEDWPDSLTAAPLSYHLNAPLLLTKASSLPTTVADAIADLGASSVIVLGGPGAVSSAVATAAAEAASIEASEVVRIGGADRYETAALIADELGVTPGAGVTVVSGETYADAASAASFSAMHGMPVLLTPKDSLASATSEFILAHAAETTTVVIVGGTGVVSSAVATAAAAAASIEVSEVERLWGANRYATNIAVVKHFWPEGDITPYAATGQNFPDALAAGSLAAKNGQPVMLFGWRYLDKVTREFIMHENARLRGWNILGSWGALDYLLDWELAKARRLPPPS
ncbi:MAG: cell wall-binding repeat-containing protein [Coriobacteriia bacterium]|nr:cell wall-binding repeat-containing protein [Coriobacteriia bacterium]